MAINKIVRICFSSNHNFKILLIKMKKFNLENQVVVQLVALKKQNLRRKTCCNSIYRIIVKKMQFRTHLRIPSPILIYCQKLSNLTLKFKKTIWIQKQITQKVYKALHKSFQNKISYSKHNHTLKMKRQKFQIQLRRASTRRTL